MSVAPPRTCLGRWYLTGVRYCGLSGKDGELSYSKAFGIAVLLTYLAGAALPASVAIVLVVSSHGTKVLLEWIRQRGLIATATASDARTRSESTSTVLRIEERRGWNSEREFQEA